MKEKNQQQIRIEISNEVSQIQDIDTLTTIQELCRELKKSEQLKQSKEDAK